VTASWTIPSGQSGTGHAVPLTSDSGYFWFFTASNVEIVVKVLKGCATNDRYWVFAGGLTNVRVSLTVRDSRNGATKQYTNPQSTAFKPIQDIEAFATCP
jgi:hypothetical protein